MYRFYEDFPGCPNPPPIAFPSSTDGGALRSLGLKDDLVCHSVIGDVFNTTGFMDFLRRPAEELSELLNSVDLRPMAGNMQHAATLALEDDAVTMDPCLRAARLLKAAWSMHEDISDGRFRADELHGVPLESRQYMNLFGTSSCYVDGVLRRSKSSAVSRIAVLARGRTFVVDFGPAYRAVTVTAIASALQEVWQLARAARAKGEGSLGSISAAGELLQQSLSETIFADPLNRESLRRLRDTFLTLCLDFDAHPRSYAEAARSAQCTNAENRWFNSSWQLVIFGNGRACAIYLFCAFIDGNTMARSASELYTRSSTVPLPAGASGYPHAAQVEALEWRLNPAGVDAARAQYSTLLNGEESTFELSDFGQRRFKAHGLDPVPAFTIAMHLAAWDILQRAPRVSEFITQSRYRYMGLKSIVTTTPAHETFRTAWQSGAAAQGQLRELFGAAAQARAGVCRDARPALAMLDALGLYRSILDIDARKQFDRRLNGAIALLRDQGLAVERSDVALSHPTIYPGERFVGRPGLRTPSIPGFFMHYQIYADRLMFTVMPSVQCEKRNAEIAAAVSRALDGVLSLFPRT